MTSERARLFAELLNEVVSVDGGFIPEEAWLALHKIIPLPCVEVIITKPETHQFLLSFRNDKWWSGWHIPGSYIRREESIEDACN